ncbi:MAG: hypothetical protein N2506_07860, partial [Dehalococcoidales bacterium]|nr:hypothetical protein [Dehalococcoidales bacterium]
MEGVPNWQNLSWQERREARFQRWLNPPVKFRSKEAARLYRERATRFIRAVKLELPDRVPCMLPSGMFPAHYAGYTLKEVMYDYRKLRRAYLKFIADFDMDTYTGPSLVFPGRAFELVDHRLHKWPGHGLADNASMFQYVEKEYLKADEYDDFLANPADFWWRVYLPRVCGAFEPFAKLPRMTGLDSVPLSFYAAVAGPDVAKALRTMIAAGREVIRWQRAVAGINRASLARGIPNVRGGSMAGAPFDTLADMLRGTHGMVMDMY